MATIEDLIEKTPLQNVASRDPVAFELYGTVQYAADRVKIGRILAVENKQHMLAVAEHLVEQRIAALSL